MEPAFPAAVKGGEERRRGRGGAFLAAVGEEFIPLPLGNWREWR